MVEKVSFFGGGGVGGLEEYAGESVTVRLLSW